MPEVTEQTGGFAGTVRTLFGVPLPQYTDAQLRDLLQRAPDLTGLDFAADLGGLAKMRSRYRETFRVVANRVANRNTMAAWQWLLKRDDEIHQLVHNARALVTMLEEDAAGARGIDDTVAADVLAATAEEVEFSYTRALEAFNRFGDTALFKWHMLLDSPKESARIADREAHDAQEAVDERERLRKQREAIGTLWLGNEVVRGVDGARTLEAVLAPLDGTDTEHEAIAFARLWPDTCAVARRGERWYVYRLSGSAMRYTHVFDDASQDGRSKLVPTGEPHPRIVLADGYVLRPDGAFYTGGDQSQFPRPFYAGSLALLERLAELPDKSALPLFKQLCFDLLLVKLADAAAHVAAAVRELDLRPDDRPAELRLLTGALRAHLQAAKDMTAALEDRAPTPQELDRYVATMAAIGQLTSTDPVAATLVVPGEDDDDPVVDPYADPEMPDSEVRDHARAALTQRRTNVDVARRRLHRAPDEVMTLQHLHEEVLMRFPLEEMLDLGDEIHWHPWKEFGWGLAEMGALVALSVAAAMTGGTVALIAAGAGLAMGTADAVEAFENAREMAAMAELGLKGDVVVVTPDEAAWAYRWAWVSVAFAVLDAGQFVREADQLARVRELLKTPDLHAALGTSGRSLRQVARDVGVDEDVLVDMLEKLDGPGRDELLLKIRKQAGTRAAGSRATVALGETPAHLDAIVKEIRVARDIPSVRALLDRGGPHATDEQLALVKRYLFDSPGIAVTDFNVAWWRRLTSNTATVADMAVLQHELAEVAHLKASRFDFLGERLQGPADDRWLVEFTRRQLAAHAHALEAEYEYLAAQVRAVASLGVKGPANRELDLPREVVAAIDPRGSHAAGNSDPYIHMRTQRSGLARPPRLGNDARLPVWRGRAGEPVRLHPLVAARLGVTSPIPLGDLIQLVKRLSPGRAPTIVGDVVDPRLVPDSRTAVRGGIEKIRRSVDRSLGAGNERDETRIEGRILTPITPRETQAPNYNLLAEWESLRDEFSDVRTYQAAHLWGPGFGDEAYAGVLLAPADFNLKWQNAGIEDKIRGLFEYADPLGAEVRLFAMVKNHGHAVVRGNTLAEVSYVVEIHHHGTRRWRGQVSATVDPPPSGRVVIDFKKEDWPELPLLAVPSP